MTGTQLCENTVMVELTSQASNLLDNYLNFFSHGYCNLAEKKDTLLIRSKTTCKYHVIGGYYLTTLSYETTLSRSMDSFISTATAFKLFL